VLYANEDNPGKDEAKAARYLAEAIRRSEPRACLIAAHKKIARGVALRRTLAEVRCAANGGIPGAMEMIAEYHLSKRSPQSRAQARNWLMRAIESGSDTAAGKLAALESR
jgi:TPR repeat protein